MHFAIRIRALKEYTGVVVVVDVVVVVVDIVDVVAISSTVVGTISSMVEDTVSKTAGMLVVSILTLSFVIISGYFNTLYYFLNSHSLFAYPYTFKVKLLVDVIGCVADGDFILLVLHSSLIRKSKIGGHSILQSTSYSQIVSFCFSSLIYTIIK
jgi:hypothetical protein